MKMTFTDLWRSSGTVDRGIYTIVGMVAFVIKHNLDRLIATYGFHRPWGLFNYWIPLRDVAHIRGLSRNDIAFLETMVAVALPFVWLGVAMTIKRLRSAQFPAALVLLFFVPFFNVLFLLFMCLVPEHAPEIARDDITQPRTSFTSRLVPNGALGSAAISLLVTVPIGLAMVLLGVDVFKNYGWGIFVAIPFVMGFSSVLIYGLREPRGFAASIAVSTLSVALLGLALLGLAFEGLFCLMMAMPLALPLAILGGAFGHAVQQRRWVKVTHPAAFSVLLIFVPGVQTLEYIAARRPPVYEVRTAIDIQASPEQVWQQVVAFSHIPPPEEWLFRAGVAYPIQAEIVGRGPGAQRRCVFSTGAFVEPIQVWDEPRRLKFSVTSNPAAMEEWTPYSHIEPPHLHGFLVSDGGQFMLTALANGGTHLEGTTWYRHTLWPASYWRLWTDAIIHKIHLRVLRHIEQEATQTGRLRTLGKQAGEQAPALSPY